MPDVDQHEGPEGVLRVAEPVDRMDAYEAQEVVDDAEHRVEEHPPDQPDHHGVHQERKKQDQIVDVLAALDRVEHQRDGEAEQELEDHDRGDEAQRHPERLAELGVVQRAAVVAEAREDVVGRLDQGVVEGAGDEREEQRKQDHQHERHEARRRQQIAELPVAPGERRGGHAAWHARSGGAGLSRTAAIAMTAVTTVRVELTDGCAHWPSVNHRSHVPAVRWSIRSWESVPPFSRHCAPRPSRCPGLALATSARAVPGHDSQRRQASGRHRYRLPSFSSSAPNSSLTVASASSGLFSSVTASDSSRPSTSTNCGV